MTSRAVSVLDRLGVLIGVYVAATAGGSAIGMVFSVERAHWEDWMLAVILAPFFQIIGFFYPNSSSAIEVAGSMAVMGSIFPAMAFSIRGKTAYLLAFAALIAVASLHLVDSFLIAMSV